MVWLHLKLNCSTVVNDEAIIIQCMCESKLLIPKCANQSCFACQRLYFPTDLRVFDGLRIFEEQQSTRPLEKLDYHSKQ